MISAFGVEHGEISKGLPSALVGRGIRPGIGTQTIRMNNRVSANQQGKALAQRLSGGKKMDNYANQLKRGGQKQRGYSRQGLNGPDGRRNPVRNGFGLE